MKERVTREQIAQMANVSVTAVSRVMNNNGYVAKEKREAILKAVNETGYHLRLKSKLANKVVSKQLLFINKDLSNFFTIEIYRGMVNYASKHGYTVLLSGTLDIERIQRMLFDGVILPNHSAVDEYIDIMENKMYVPTVSASYGAIFKNTKRIPLIEVDVYAAMEMMVDYLLSRSHKKIALATPFASSDGDLRYTAYRNKMLPILGDKIDEYIFVSGFSHSYFTKPEDDYVGYGRQIAQTIYDNKSDVTAVCCFNDSLAIGVLQQFCELGVNVPGDISVVGIDGLNIGNYIHPKLTTVSLSPFEQGQECVRVLLDSIAGKKVRGLTKIPMSICEGESTRVL